MLERSRRVHPWWDRRPESNLISKSWWEGTWDKGRETRRNCSPWHGSGNRRAETRRCRKSGRPLSGQVHSRRNSRPGRKLGYCSVVGRQPTTGKGSGPNQHPFGGQTTPTRSRSSSWTWLLSQLRAVLGSRKLRCWKLVPMGKLRTTQRPRRKEQERKRKRWTREERTGCLETRHATRRRSREAQRGEVKEGETGPTPGIDSQVLGWADQLIWNAFRAADEVERQAALSPNPIAVSPCKLLGPPPEHRSEVAPGQTLCTTPSSEEDWRQLTLNSRDAAQLGRCLPWGLAHGYTLKGMEILDKVAKPFATAVASKTYKSLFPLPMDLGFLKGSCWPTAGFPGPTCHLAWLQLVVMALNQLFGCDPPYPAHRRGKSVEKCLAVLSDRISRFLSQSPQCDCDISQVWDEVKNKTVNYVGEEVAVAQTLTVSQVLPSMPPLGHGGSVELAPLLIGRSRFLIEHPEEVLLPIDEQPRGKSTAKVHIKPGEEVEFARLLADRGIISFVPEDQVHSGPNGKFLSGLFGVPKPNKYTSENLPVLRLIMNLIPVNRIMGVVLGDIQELPSAADWQQLVLSPDECLSVSQADMQSAFYLFRLPSCWQKYLCFNLRLRASDVGAGASGFVYPACTVLPMGWSSSVGLMQMASRELIRRVKLPSTHELRKQTRVPEWFVQVAKRGATDCSWWQVYLDNFMSAEVRQEKAKVERLDLLLHQAAVGSWEEHGVLCSADKHVFSAEVAVELGVQLHGPNGLVGASGDRIMRTILASLALIKQRQGKVKQVQVVLGRWIFIF